MTRFGYHASHEQYPPSELLEYVRLAEQAGFDGALSSDHFHPWIEENGHSGFSWSWLGAAMQSTRMTFGTVNAPGHRYHPALIAQAAATLAEMFPDRFWMAIGTGEAVNEHITGGRWPAKAERQRMLRECADVMRRLWAGETVTHRGAVVVDAAKLYSLPPAPPRLFGAAVSESTAEWLGSWADGLITTGRPRQEMQAMIDAFVRGDGAGKPVYVQHVLAWHPDEQEARRQAHEQWRFATLESAQLWDLRTPRDFAAATTGVTEAEVSRKIPTSSSLDRHLEALESYIELGVERVFVLNVVKGQPEFIRAFGPLVRELNLERG